MKTSLQHLQAAHRDQNMPLAAHLLCSLVQEQHPTTLLTIPQQRQFARCCQHLVYDTPCTPGGMRLLLSAEVCFNYAYGSPGQMGARGCCRHPRQDVMKEACA
ncbi:hypothetical protein [Hymenobacter cellulosivorans]|uniref:Uncharacterized protein n=1 Tax=Hymenobacter cellulosivorans TaxID=2932249 RepID=A0ABY4F864_9BACT|nr:hypothetical protein [Hymenobacter cellulosivorans]UOQ52302.1 hypothetical protein MUN80_21390 [Hymenobacter cellulosivorans]